MAYIGKSIESGTFSVLDTSGNTYNGSNTTFSLGTQVGSAAQLLVSHDGVIQKPGTDYSLASGGTQITFSTAPASGASIFIVEISGAVGGPLDSDLNGSELILDTDGDTSITADTDDQIDFKVANADQIKLTDGVLAPSTDNDIDLGTSSLEFKDAFFDGTVTTDGLTVSGTPSFADGSIAIADLDIDGGTDIGADIVDADLFIIDDGAGGTNRKTAASRLKTYIGSAGLVHLNTTTGTSNTATVSLNDVFSGYVIYKVLGAVLVDTDSLKIKMQYTKSNGGTVGTASSYRYLYSARDINTSNGIADASNGNFSNADHFQLAYNMDTDATYSPCYFDLNFYDPGQSFASYQFFDGKITFQTSGNRLVTGVIGGQYRENFNATGLKFSLNASGNYTRYYFNTYGITNSGS